MCSLEGGSQTSTPSVAIGSHVLTLGMPESTVLEQLGTDFILRKLPAGVKPIGAATSPESAWAIQRKTESGFVEVGTVTFDSHRLTTVIRNWNIQESSSKSFFYAVNEAMKSLEADGLTACRIATYSRVSNFVRAIRARVSVCLVGFCCAVIRERALRLVKRKVMP